MAIKKHHVKINVVDGERQAPGQSSFLVDLRSINTPASENNLDSLASSELKNNSADFLVASKKQDEPLGLGGAKIRKIFFRSFHRLFFYSSIAGRKLSGIFRNGFNYLSHFKLKKRDIDIIPLRKLLPQPKRKHSMWSFILILLLIIIPFKLLTYYQILNLDSWQNSLIGQSMSGVNKMILASDSAGVLNLDEASQGFGQASEDFAKAQERLKEVDELVLALASFSGDEKIKLASQSKKLLLAGEISARLGSNLTLALDSLVGSGQMNEKIGPRIDNFRIYGREAISDIKELNRVLDRVDPKFLPSEYRQKFIDLKGELSTLQGGLINFVNLANSLGDFLGSNIDKRYLLVFQNNNELRASGGFVGSYPLVDLRDGRIKNLEVPGGGSYDTAGGLRVLIAAPQPLWLVNPLWHFWDANWWPDWELSAKNLMWFLEKSDGPSVDGAISFTPTVIEKLLTVTGPIDLSEKYGVIITADNFWEVTQSIVEKTGNPEIYASSTPLGQQLVESVQKNEEILASQSKERPKEIIGDLMDKIMLELPKKLDRQNLFKLLKIVDESLNEKQVMFYFSDFNLQQKMVSNSWAGKIKSAPNDYLSVINTNIAGAKSDRVIEESINHQIEIQSDGYIFDNLTITRSHLGQKGVPFTGVRNVDWMRIYVPLGSELLES
ncbi:MAG: DUF4012 domain-containing protein, partial [Patescibacteria group bacterium]